MLKDKKVCLTYLVFCIKQPLKVQKNTKVYMAYIVAFTAELYCKILDGRKIC